MFRGGSNNYFRSRNVGSHSPPVGSAGSLGSTAVKRIAEGGSPSSVFEGRAFYETGSETEDEEPRIDLLSLLEQHWYGQRTLTPQRAMSAPEALPDYTAATAPQRAMSAPLPLRSAQRQHAPEPPTPFTRPAPVKVPLPAKTGARPPPTAPVPVPHSGSSFQGPAVAQAPGRAHSGSLLVSPTAAAGGPTRSGSCPRAALPLTPTAGGVGVNILVSSVSSGNGSCSSLGSEEGRELAWRWRFSRKWVAVGQHQQQDQDAMHGSGSSGDCDLLDAIEYAQACGMGAHLQVTNHELRRCSGMLPKSQSCQFDLSGHGRCNALEALLAVTQHDTLGDSANPQAGSFQSWEQGRLGSGGTTDALCHMGGGLQQQKEEEAEQHSATMGVLTLASAARDLLEKQQLIEEALQSRVGQCLYGPEAAACGNLEQVRIPMSGRFPFALLRALDSSGRQRYLIRTGERPLADPANILKAAVSEAAALCKRQGLLPVDLELIGSGVMEWRQDTDRHLHISAPAVAAPLSRAASGTLGGLGGSSCVGGWGAGPRCGLGGGVAALASCLVRQALPWHFQVSHSSSF